MKLHEYQAKQILTEYGLLIPNGKIIRKLNEIKYLISKEDKGPWVVKCQIHAGNRYKSDGIKIVKSKEEICLFAKKWLGKYLITNQTNSDGQIVNIILIEEYINIIQELYLSIIIDQDTYKITFIVSILAGSTIEEESTKNPELIFKIIIDPLLGPQPYQARELAYQIKLHKDYINEFIKIFMILSKLFIQNDFSLIEINPLAITNNKKLICLDSKLILDDNALFRHPNFYNLRDFKQENKYEALAIKYGINYVTLNGNIGCIVNGAGLAMSTMDLIYFYGGKPANFLDIGGNINKNILIKAFKIIISQKNIKSIFINIFGGIVRCDLIAESLLDILTNMNIKTPIVIRLEGNQAKLALQILAKNNLNLIINNHLINAIKQVIFISEN